MAAVIPTTVQSSSDTFQPCFAFVSTEGDRHADALAVVASIAGVSLKDVFRQAEALGMPSTGPYYHWIDSDLIGSLLAAYGWSATEWKEFTSLTHLPSLSICLVEYDRDWEAGGRHVLVHSGVKCSHDNKAIINYVVDVSSADPKSQIRTDLKATLKPSWYIGVQPMKTPPTPAKK